MEMKKILRCVDHTLLSPDCTWSQVKQICEDGINFQTASICIPQSFVKPAVEFVEARVAVCTVVGFPNGYSFSQSKLLEARLALSDGATEIDMVINIGDLKEKKYAKIQAEIEAVKSVCAEKVLKVIVETCLLTEEEKIRMCEIVTNAKANYIKTSTGFSKAGATKEDVVLFSKFVGKDVGIKASGGIKSLADAEDFLALGASRLGTSQIVAIAKTLGMTRF